MSKRNKDKGEATVAEIVRNVEIPAIVPDANVAEIIDASNERVAEILASIDPTMETAATAGVVDHDTQRSSWTPEGVAAETQLSEVVAELESLGEQPADETPPAETDQPTLAQLIAGVDEETAQLAVVEFADEIDARAKFEDEKNPENGNIHKTLKKVRTQLVTMRAAKLFEAINVSSAFINRSVHEGSGYNVYAMGKLSDIVYGVTDGVVANAINVACMKSLFAFNKAGVPFTMECAKAAASKSYARGLDASVRKHLISHTVAPSTAPTQASSTMQALVTLGVVRTNGAGKNPTYFLQDAPIVRKLEQMLAAA